MSKASEYRDKCQSAIRRRKDPEAIPGLGINLHGTNHASVGYGGSLYLSIHGSNLNPDEALKLADWIYDIFGEEKPT
jgi:hypothetical protein